MYYEFFVFLGLFRNWFSLSLRLLYKEDRHFSLSLASSSNLSVPTSKLFRSRLQKSLKSNIGRPRLFLPSNISMYSRDFVAHSQSMTKSANLRWLRVKFIIASLVRLNTSTLVISCCHIIQKIRRRHRRWKILIYFSYTLNKIHVSLHSRVLLTQTN